MHKEECIRVKFSEGLGIFDQHYGYPEIDEQEIYDGPTGKVIDIQGIQAHAGCNFFVPEGKEFSFDIDECPYLYIEIKAEPGTSTCLFLLVHERKHDWNRRFVVIGKTPKGECRRHLMSNYFTIKDDNNWHEYVYDLRKIREEKDNNVYHQPLCPDAGSIREIQFYAWTGTGKHTFNFNCLEAVQQFKIGRKRKTDNALNLKRRNIFGVKTKCETASKERKNYEEIKDMDQLLGLETEILKKLNEEEGAGAQFIEDPVGTLLKMGFPLSKRLYKDILRQRAKTPMSGLADQRMKTNTRANININVRFVPHSGENFEKPPKTSRYTPKVYRGRSGKRGKSKYSGKKEKKGGGKQ
jgi:hypothetical protein